MSSHAESRCVALQVCVVQSSRRQWRANRLSDAQLSCCRQLGWRAPVDCEPPVETDVHGLSLSRCVSRAFAKCAIFRGMRANALGGVRGVTPSIVNLARQPRYRVPLGSWGIVD